MSMECWKYEKLTTTSNHNNIFFIEYIQIPVYTFINIILLHTCIVEIKELNNVFISLRIFTIIYSMNFFCECYSQYVELQNSEYWYMYSFCMHILSICVFIIGCTWSNDVPSAHPPSLCRRSPLNSAPSCWTQTPRGQSPWWWTPQIHSPNLLQNCSDNKGRDNT